MKPEIGKQKAVGRMALGFLLGVVVLTCMAQVYRVINNLQDLTNVRLAGTPSNNDVLLYNTSLGKWTNGTASAGAVMNQNQFDSSSTNIKAGVVLTNTVMYSSAAASAPLTVNNSAGTLLFKINTNGYAEFGTGGDDGEIRAINGVGLSFSVIGNGTPHVAMTYSGGNWMHSLFSAASYGWTATTTIGSGTQDTALRRNAANTVEFDSGTTGIANRGTLLAAKYTGRAGTSSTSFNASGLIVVDSSSVTNSGASSTVLQTNSIGANVLAANGDLLDFEYACVFANNGNSKQLVLTYNGTTIFDSTAALWGVSAETPVSILGKIVRTGAATQKCMVRFVPHNAAGSALPAVAYTSTTATLSGAVPLVLSGTGAATGDVFKFYTTIEHKPAP